MTGPEQLRIRAMSAGDLDAVLALERASESAPHWAPMEYLGLLEPSAPGRLAALRRFAVVADLGAGIAGFAVLRLLADPDGGEAELESLVVSGEWRGRGIGTALMMELLNLAKAHGAARVDLEVRASNRAALSLYGRSGLLEIGRRRRYYRDPDEDAVLMRINL
jgi:ribosomal-protein-alanine N-acetyltransferase